MQFFLKIISSLLKIENIFINKLTILTYHSVSDGSTPLSVKTENFDEQMKFMKENFNVLDAGSFSALLKNRNSPLSKSALITFDDGFEDVFLNALPILKKYSLSAIVFVNPYYVGKKASFATRTEDKDRGICSLEQLRGLAKNSVAIANHGFHHKPMASLSEEEMGSEFLKTKEWIDTSFDSNKFPLLFVFPKGSYNENVLRVLNEVGAEAITVKRLDIYPDWGIEYFALNLSFVFAGVKKLVKFIKGIINPALFKD